MSNHKRKPLYGVGINDADYVVQPRVNGKQVTCPYYRCWHSMFVRCYSGKLPAYRGVTVRPDWFSFMAFRAWMQKQDWQGKALDKDLKYPQNKVYSEDACIFISQAINSLFTDHRAARGSLPIGVIKHYSKFRARCSVDGVFKHIGIYPTVEEAHKAYLDAKNKYVTSVAINQEEPLKTYLLNFLQEQYSD